MVDNPYGTKIGIERIGFYTTNAKFSLFDLASHTKNDNDKYLLGLGQKEMSVITPDEDIITMAYSAVFDCLLQDEDVNNVFNQVGLLLFATESAVDNSKSSACELHKLLTLDKKCRCLDIKHACYGGTGALMLAKDDIKANPFKKALVVMSDVAFYGINTKGEPTQGCGAVAVLISTTPKIAVFNDDNVYLTAGKNDFYRPAYQMKPFYDGHLSVKSYLSMFEESYKQYIKDENVFDFLVSHMPFSKMLDKCCKVVGIDVLSNNNQDIKKYSSIVGNLYTASLYLGFLSLLENSNIDFTDKKIALFSYGSGAECELFSMTMLKNYSYFLNTEKHKKMLNNRKMLSYDEYCCHWNEFEKREQSLNWGYDKNINKTSSRLTLVAIKDGVRVYQKNF